MNHRLIGAGQFTAIIFDSSFFLSVLKFLLFGAILSMMACKTSPPASTEQATGSRSGETTESKPDSTYRAAYTSYFDLIHTTLRLKPVWSRSEMEGMATIRLRPYFYPTDSLILDARGMIIHQVMMEDGSPSGTSLDYQYDGKKLKVHFTKMLNRNDTATISIRYTSQPEKLPESGSDAISSDLGLYFINADGSDPDKPKQLWTQGETEANSSWFPTIESPSQKMTQDIYLTVDSNLITLSNGRLITSATNQDGTRTDHWQQLQPAAPYLTMIAVGPFSKVEDHWRGKEVSYYLDEPYKKYARTIFGKTPEMIEFFSRLLNLDFPWDKYAQIVVHDFVSGAMENTTAVVHGTNMQQDPREMLDGNYENFISHELIHHWFGDLVTCESWSQITLNEGFANYGEYLWNEHRYGREYADRELQKDLAGYLQTARQSDPPLIRYYYNDEEDLYDAISYNKGGCVLHMLRHETGDSAFFAAISDYLKSNAYSSVEINDLRRSFEKTTGQDLNWFFNQWYLRGGHPVLRISYRWDEDARTQYIRLEQTQDFKFAPVYRLKLKTDIYLKDTVIHETIDFNTKVKEFEFRLSEKPLLVNVDAEKTLVCTKKDQHSREEWRYQYKNAPLYLDRYEAIATISKDYKSDSPDAGVMQVALNDKAQKIRQLAIEHCGPLLAIDSARIKDKLLEMALKDNSSDVRTSALKALKKHFRYPEYEAALKAALKDSSYQVVATSFETISKFDTAYAKTIAPELESDSSSAVLSVLATYYVTDTLADHTLFYDRAIIKTKSWERYSVIQSYSNYLKCSQDPMLDRGIDRLVLYCRQHKRRYARSAGIAALRKIERAISDRIYSLKQESNLTPAQEESLQRYESQSEKILGAISEFDKTAGSP